MLAVYNFNFYLSEEYSAHAEIKSKKTKFFFIVFVDRKEKIK